MKTLLTGFCYLLLIIFILFLIKNLTLFWLLILTWLLQTKSSVDQAWAFPKIAAGRGKKNKIMWFYGCWRARGPADSSPWALIKAPLGQFGHYGGDSREVHTLPCFFGSTWCWFGVFGQRWKLLSSSKVHLWCTFGINSSHCGVFTKISSPGRVWCEFRSFWVLWDPALGGFIAKPLLHTANTMFGVLFFSLLQLNQ